MTARGNSTKADRSQVGPVTLALMAMHNDGEVKRCKRIIPPPSTGSGYVVICRDPETGVLKRFGRRPYEHPTQEAAEEEAARLAEELGQGFAVFMEVSSIPAPEHTASFIADSTHLDIAAEAALPAPQVAKPPAEPDSPKPRQVIVERRGARRRAAGGQA